MTKNKLAKFRDNELRLNVIQPGKPIMDSLKGSWNKKYFNNSLPIILELACGRGEYTVGLARRFPSCNFVGVDIKGSRLWTGSRSAELEGLKNVAFLRIQIQSLESYFAENEVESIWITFPDPRPRTRDIRRRLTHPRYLTLYRNIMKPGGWVYLKTDNEGLFRYTLETLKTFDGVDNLEWTDDLYASKFEADHFGLQTRYEQKYLEQGTKIKFLKFRLFKERS